MKEFLLIFFLSTAFIAYGLETQDDPLPEFSEETLPILNDKIGTISRDLRNLSSFGRVATGTYTGDGATSQMITGVGFQPKYVKIWAHLTNVSSHEKLDQTWGTNAFVPDTPAFADNQIISLDSDGFTVDDAGADAHPNKNGTVYDYLALGAGE